MIDNSKLASLYASINTRGRRAILAGDEVVDERLADLTADKRRGLSLIMHLPAHVTRNINFALQELQKVEPQMYYYPADQMHLTVLDIIGAHDNFNCPPDQLAGYEECLRRACAQVGPVDWHLAGVIVSPGAVMVKGYYTPALAQLREQVRQSICQQGLPLSERYKTISGHVTVARFSKPLLHRQALLNFCAANGQLGFGDFQTRSVDLVIHDWYNRVSTTRLVKRFCLAGNKNY